MTLASLNYENVGGNLIIKRRNNQKKMTWPKVTDLPAIRNEAATSFYPTLPFVIKKRREKHPATTCRIKVMEAKSISV